VYVESLEHLEPYDTVYLSPHPDDVALSCPGVLIEDRRESRRVLVATLFSTPHAGRLAEERRCFAELGVDHLALGLPDAADRDPRFRTPSGLLLEETEQDRELAGRIARHLEEVLERARPATLFLPLGVGGHIDHRLAHTAGTMAASGREIHHTLCYEDRPYAFVDGAVQLRLASLGMFADAPDFRQHPGFRVAVSYVWSAVRSGFVTRMARPADVLPSLRGLHQLTRSARGAATVPALHVTRCWDARFVVRVAGLVSAYRSQFPDPPGSIESFKGQALRYSRRMGHTAAYAERFWQLPVKTAARDPARESIPVRILCEEPS
jgi:LmbE family N-acetylglucosaminyl deacetylase